MPTILLELCALLSFLTFSSRLRHMLIQLLPILNYSMFPFFSLQKQKNCNKLPVFLYLVSLRNWNCIILVESSNLAGRKDIQLIAGSCASLNSTMPCFPKLHKYMSCYLKNKIKPFPVVGKV